MQTPASPETVAGTGVAAAQPEKGSDADVKVHWDM
jgi:hypothetical protein